MDFKTVKLVETEEPKSVQEIEEKLLEEHEQSVYGDSNESDSVDQVDNDVHIEQEENNYQQDLKEEDVLSYIEKRYNKKINSFDELISERKYSDDVPEDVSAYIKYRKETGRGFDDFLKLREDFDSMPEDDLLKKYLAETQEGLDDDDIEVMMDEYRYDEDYDDDSYVKKTRIARKKAVNEAKKYFNSQKDKYNVPLESSMQGVSEIEKEEFEAYKEYIKNAQTFEEENSKKRQWFEKKTDEVFGSNFKGFDFTINDKKMTFSPGDAKELKRLHSNPASFIGKFIDDNGLLKDAEGYHRALSIAMNPERFAKFFYEQGAAHASDDFVRKTKNINMSERKATETTKSQGGFQIREVNPDHGKSLKIKSKRL